MYDSIPLSALRPLEIEMLRSEIRENTTQRLNYTPAGVVLTVKTGDEWLKQECNTPMPKRLFGEFWYEHELCVLFADTNMGKSMLAVQLANSLARAERIEPFGLDMDRRQVVLYIDFELTAKQFEQRYRDPATGNPHTFGARFFRAEFNPMSELTPGFKDREHQLNSAIESAINKTQATVLIIDNLTCLRSGTEKAADALPLMKHLKYLKAKFNLSILVLAHTPKRNPLKPITRNDLQGSKMLINFCDSAFAIGESYQEKGLRYLKQIKQRNTHEVYV
ncbi:AAA family ATPase [Mucilaginibacter robiniae]|uniref:AAA family ATPase n=1 Tax=Mucilaginibacter robiniae TaxID=2728022 RepID=A0A7L5DVK4_9SPHI|nr:AAA family ATPase [Mucilaginibacter robiniae]QJD95120.1 AAA family ATPase [Mucilaginibacter robiniae]